MSAVMDGPLGGLISIIGTLGAGIALAVPAIAALSAAMSFFSVSILPAITASWALLAPWLPFIAIGAAIVAIIYEIGKAFGWWTDASSMVDAIGAGLQRLWNAFINHPDVQAAIAAISNALSTLWSWIQQAGQAILEFFGVSTGGDFDIVRALIDGIGVAWQVLTGHIRAGIQVVQMVISGFQSLYNGAVSLGSYIGDVLSPVFSMLSELWNSLVEAVQPIVDVFQRFSSGQTDLLTVITTVASTLWNLWVTLSANLGALMLTLVSNLLTWATQAGLNVLTGIATYLMQVPVRVATYLAQTLTRIISYGARWVTQARAKASQLVNGVISFLRQLPGRALSALLGVVSSIVSAGSQWISHAKQKASEVVSSVVNTLTGLPGKISSALSGVASAITGPFKQAYDTLCGIVDNIKSKASEVTGIAFGGETAWGGETAIDLGTGNSFNTNTGAYTNESSEINVNVTEKIILDLVNVPAHIDSNTLIRMLQDKEVLKSLTRNKDFQDLDNQVKQELMAKIRRSKGA
jgi:phage-related protein